MWTVTLGLAFSLLALPGQGPTTPHVHKTFGDVALRISNRPEDGVAHLKFAVKNVIADNSTTPPRERLLGILSYQTMGLNAAGSVQIRLERVERFRQESPETALFAGPAVLSRRLRNTSSVLRGTLVVTVFDSFDPTDLLEPNANILPRQDRVNLRFFVPENAQPVYQVDGIVSRGDLVVLERDSFR
jgi:hypothetical protein